MRRVPFQVIMALVVFVLGQALAVAQAQRSSTNDYSSRAQDLVGSMEISADSVRKQLQSARSQRDSVKALCVSDKLNQVDTALRSATELQQTIAFAEEQGQAQQAEQALTQLSMLKRNADMAKKQASQCMGTTELRQQSKGSTRAAIEDLFYDDPTSYPDIEFLAAEPPACASCLK